MSFWRESMRPDPERWTVKSAMYCLALFAVACAVFGNTIAHGFVWDDVIFLVNNRAYREFDLHRIWFSLANGVEYLPVRDLSYAADFAVWGGRAAGFHATNVVLYGITVVLVFLFTRRLQSFLAKGREAAAGDRAELVALLAAALFAVHPVHSEVVSFVTCRNALLSALFFFLSCQFHLLFLDARGPRRGAWYAAALACFAASLLSKATGITLPLVIMLFNGYRYRRRPARGVLWALPYVALALAAFFGFRSVAQQSYILRSTGFDAGVILAKAAVALQIPWFYLAKFLLPVGLSAEYDTRFAPSVTSPAAAAGLVLVVLLVWLAVRCRRRDPRVSIGIGWYVATLVPVSNLFSTHPVVADRYALLPSFAFCYLLASFLAGLRPAGRSGAGLAAGVGLVLLWGGMSVQRNRVWRDDKTLWEGTVRVSPGSVNARAHLGRLYFIEGRYDEAFTQLDAARQLDFRSPEYDYFEGYLAYVRQDYPRAIDCFRRSLARDPDFIETLYFMGSAYEATGAKGTAAGYYRLAVRSPEPDNARLKPLAQGRLAGAN
jgi:tetratricopeptide (TPR) repeat protein